MDPYGKKELLDFYNRHLERFGDQPQALRWTPEGQRRRHEQLLRIAGELSGKEILDFGCGKGDLYGLLLERGSSARYCGIDINGSLVELARSKYPDAEFLALDVEEDTVDRSWDVVMICGVFNLRIAGIEKSMENVLRFLFSRCREALHLNVPSTLSKHKDIDMHYSDPGSLLRFALAELSPAATLRHNLVAGDIFLSVYRGKTPPVQG